MGTRHADPGTSVYRLADRYFQIIREAPRYAAALENFGLVYNKKECLAIDRLKIYLCSRRYFPKDFNEIVNDDEFSKLFEDTEQDFVNCMKDFMRGIYHWWFYGMAYEYIFNESQAELFYGYKGLLNFVLRNVGKEKVILNKEVIHLDYSDFENPVERNSYVTRKTKVYCRDGTTYLAHHVIVTVPLGYLKENYKTLFNPPLPEVKINAMQSLNYVTVDKIFFDFEQPFWKSSDVYHVIWSEKLDNLFEDHKHGTDLVG